jgi:WD40 repeat protein
MTQPLLFCGPLHSSLTTYCKRSSRQAVIPSEARNLSSSVSRHSPLVARHFFLRVLCALCALCVNSFLPSAAPAQNLDKPLQSIDEEITAFAFAPDGRIAYSVYRNLKTKQYDLEHDDIWLQEANGKRRRFLEGQKFTRGNQLFSYLVDSLRWSPNDHFLLVQLLVTTVEDDSGRGVDSFQTLLFDDSGHEVRIAKGDSFIPDAANATFLPDNNTIAYLTNAVRTLPLFSLKTTRLSTGSLPSPHEGRTFRDVAWLPGMNFAAAVEQDHSMSGPPRLQSLDILSDSDKELATLEGYEGGLTVSPDGTKVAYFIDREVLEIRSLSNPNQLARVRVGLGVYRWTPDESRIFLKRAVEKKSGDIVWFPVPPLVAVSPGKEIPVSQPTPVPVLHGLSFREFSISPDGRLLGVVVPGKRNLLVFPLPSR